jgi:hypothetical protein
MSEKRSPSCGRCGVRIECCAFCQENGCRVPICEQCLKIAIGMILEQPHGHGG